MLNLLLKSLSWRPVQTLRVFGAGSLYAAVAMLPVAPVLAEERMVLSSEASLDNTFVYRCRDNFRFVAHRENDKLWLFLPDKTEQLGLLRSASGVYFESDEIQYWAKDEEATLRWEGRNYDCRNDRRAAIREASKLNGYDFRATGNEPGWSLEIGQGLESILVTDYGHMRYLFELPEPSRDEGSAMASKVTKYQVKDPLIEIIIKQESCVDSMSGERFGSAVHIRKGEQSYQGCGRALH